MALSQASLAAYTHDYAEAGGSMALSQASLAAYLSVQERPTDRQTEAWGYGMGSETRLSNLFSSLKLLLTYRTFLPQVS